MSFVACAHRPLLRRHEFVPGRTNGGDSARGFANFNRDRPELNMRDLIIFLQGRVCIHFRSPMQALPVEIMLNHGQEATKDRQKNWSGAAPRRAARARRARRARRLGHIFFFVAFSCEPQFGTQVRARTSAAAAIVPVAVTSK